MRSSELQEFHIREESEPDRVVRLILYGDLDLAAVEELDQRVSRAMTGSAGVRLDLSQLRFIDVCGMRAVIRAVGTARDRGTAFEVDPRVSRCVARLIGLIGGEAGLWPPAGQAGRARGRNPHASRRRATSRARGCTADQPGAVRPS